MTNPAYTVSSETYTTRKGLAGPVVQKTRIVILFNGAVHTTAFDDGMTVSDLAALVDSLNANDAAAVAYRAQFATEEEWMRHLDESAAG